MATTSLSLSLSLSFILSFSLSLSFCQNLRKGTISSPITGGMEVFLGKANKWTKFSENVEGMELFIRKAKKINPPKKTHKNQQALRFK